MSWLEVRKWSLWLLGLSLVSAWIGFLLYQAFDVGKWLWIIAGAPCLVALLGFLIAGLFHTLTADLFGDAQYARRRQQSGFVPAHAVQGAHTTTSFRRTTVEVHMVDGAVHSYSRWGRKRPRVEMMAGFIDLLGPRMVPVRV